MYRPLMMLFKCVILAFLCLEGGLGACVCQDPAWCEPVRDVPHDRKEVFVFSSVQSTNWRQYDWDIVTTVSVFGASADRRRRSFQKNSRRDEVVAPFREVVVTPELVCRAHQNKARVTVLALFPLAQLGNETFTDSWIQDALRSVESQGLDGVFYLPLFASFPLSNKTPIRL
jgi:hypothetical protein